VGTSDIFDRLLPEEAVEILARSLFARKEQGKAGALILDTMGGAIDRLRWDETAFVHRKALFSIQYFASLPEGTAAAVLDEAATWQRALRAQMRRWSTGRAYQNYPGPQLANWKNAFYGRNYPRLVRVKAAYDPDGLFRFPQGIR
jgi:hypothetical protein